MDYAPSLLLGGAVVTGALLVHHISILHASLLVLVFIVASTLTSALILQLMCRRPLASQRWRHYSDELRLLFHHALPDHVPAPRRGSIPDQGRTLSRGVAPGSVSEPESATDAVQAELIGLVGDVERQCILSWYADISRESSFPRRTKSLLDEAVYDLTGRVAALSPRRLLLRLTRLLHLHVRQLRRAASRAGTDPLEQHYHYRHPVCCGTVSEGAYLTAVMVRLLAELAPARLRLAGSSELALARLLARCILGEVLDWISKPVNLLRWILDVVQEYERSEQRRGLSGERPPTASPLPGSPPPSPRMQPSHVTAAHAAGAAAAALPCTPAVNVMDRSSQTQDEYMAPSLAPVSDTSAVYRRPMRQLAALVEASSQTRRVSCRPRYPRPPPESPVCTAPPVTPCGPFAKLWRPSGRIGGATRFPFGGGDVVTGITEQEYRHRLEEHQRRRVRERARRRRRLQPRRSSSAGDVSSLETVPEPAAADGRQHSPSEEAFVAISASRSELELSSIADVSGEERSSRGALVRTEAVQRNPLIRADELDHGRSAPPVGGPAAVTFSVGGDSKDDTGTMGSSVPAVLFASGTARQEPLLDVTASAENPRRTCTATDLITVGRAGSIARSASSESIPHRARAKFQSLLQSAAQGIASKTDRSRQHRPPPLEPVATPLLSGSSRRLTAGDAAEPNSSASQSDSRAVVSDCSASAALVVGRTDPVPVGPHPLSPNGSPQYEDGADFADTIAKLRAVLDAKGANSASLSSSSADTPSYASCPPAMQSFSHDESTAANGLTPSSAAGPAPTSSATVATTVTSGGGADTVRSVIDGVRQRLFQRDNSAASSIASVGTARATAGSISTPSGSITGSYSSPGGPRSLESLPQRDSAASLFSNKSDRELELTSFPEEILEAAELPMDGRIFVNVVISGTETQRERGGGEYTLYTVQYDGLYLAAAEGEGEDAEAAEPAMVLKTNVVRRRFREFLNLHARLEANSEYRPLLKGIKEPSRWQTLPFGRLDSAAIVSRRTFLERYLGQLCARPRLSTSDELKQFMAYETDASIAFIRKPVINVPRIDQMFTKTMSGVLKTIRTALPSFESGGEAQRRGSEERVPISAGYKYNVHVMCGTDEQMSPVELRLKELIVEWDNLSAVPAQRRPSAPLVPSMGPVQSDLSSDDETAQYDRELPLASALLDLCVETLRCRRHWVASGAAVRTAKVVLGRHIEHKLTRILERAVRPAACVEYLRILRQALFPGEPEPDVPSGGGRGSPPAEGTGGSTGGDTQCSPLTGSRPSGTALTQSLPNQARTATAVCHSAQQTSMDLSAHLQCQSTNQSPSSLPQLRSELIAAALRIYGGVGALLGRGALETVVGSLVDSLLSARINRDLALQLLDCLLVDLVPDLVTGQT